MPNSAWYLIETETRAHIKEALLSQLGGNQQVQSDSAFMKDLCLCISAIAVVEIPTESWPEFIGIMCN